MTVSVAFNGSNITTASSTTGWGVVKVTSGGGTPSLAVADGSIDGDGAVTITSNQKRVILYFDVGAGNELDFSPGGANEGQFVYIWAQFLAAGLLNPYQSGGFGVFMDSNAPGTSQHSLWYVYGNDNYAGGWKRFIIDPTTTPSNQQGSAITLSSVRYFGVFAETTATARFDNLVCDRIDVGTGYTVTGTSTVGLFQELLNYEKSGTPNNIYGIVKSLNDSENAYELAGKLILGDTSATNSTISDEDSKIFVAEPIYYDVGGAQDAPSIPTSAFGIDVVGGSGVESLALGQAVGSTGGRNGITLVGNNTYQFSIDFSDGNVETGNWYGCSLENLDGTLAFDSSTHNFKGNTVVGSSGMTFVASADASECSFVSCAPITLGTGATLTDCIITESTGTQAVTTEDLNNLTGCSFTKGTSGHAVTLTALGSGTMNWDCVANGYDAGTSGSPVTPTSTGSEAIYVNVASGSLTINVQSGATVPSIRSAGATVNVVSNQVTLTLTGLQSNSEVRIYSAGTTTELAGVENSGTSFQYTYTYAASTCVDIVVHNINYVYYRVENYELGSGNASLPISQIFDRNYSNP